MGIPFFTVVSLGCIFGFIILILGIEQYNLLVEYRNEVRKAWAQIDVQLNRRADLIPNLVETVKGYAEHESTVLSNVTHARAGLMNANTVEGTVQANNELNSTLKTLFAVAEDYPDLKANENFIDLQNQLRETEDKIGVSREFYNDAVLKYNNQCESFPGNIFASLFNFNTASFFVLEGEVRQVPKVKF